MAKGVCLIDYPSLQIARVMLSDWIGVLLTRHRDCNNLTWLVDLQKKTTVKPGQLHIKSTRCPAPFVCEHGELVFGAIGDELIEIWRF